MITCRVHDRLVGELIRVRGNDANFSQKFEEASKKLEEHISSGHSPRSGSHTRHCPSTKNKI
jgi:hypothetical protein